MSDIKSHEEKLATAWEEYKAKKVLESVPQVFHYNFLQEYVLSLSMENERMREALQNIYDMEPKEFSDPWNYAMAVDDVIEKALKGTL